jgi:putative ABC transport system permease protein
VILGNILRVALRSLGANKTRMMLTMLGIIIGVAAVIAMLALGEGAREETLSRFRSMGANLLMLGNRWGSARRQFLSVDEWHAVEELGEYVESTAPEVYRTVQGKHLENTMEVRATGTSPSYFTVRNVEIEFGRPFDEREFYQQADVCVIGAEVAAQLFPLMNPMNQPIYVGGRRLVVVGVAKARGQGWASPDERVIAPLGTVMDRIMGQPYLDNVHIAVHSHDLVQEAEAAVRDLMRRRRALTPEEEDNFRFFNLAELIDRIEGQIAIFKALLGGVAAISLLVGGIGIMNIMLVTVTERTREIGIRKALGARRSHIMLQFLIESVVVACAGGALGIALGWGVAAAFDRFVEAFHTLITANSVILAVSCSTAIGIIFGIYPARRAAHLDPIEALRHE